MSVYWATEELPIHAWNSDQPPPDDRRLSDLWGQGLTAAAADTMTTVKLANQEYL